MMADNLYTATKSFLRLHFNCFSDVGYFRFLIYFSSENFNIFVGRYRSTAIVWQLFHVFGYISAPYGKNTMPCDHTHLSCYGNKHFYHTLSNRLLWAPCKLDSLKAVLNLYQHLRCDQTSLFKQKSFTERVEIWLKK